MTHKNYTLTLDSAVDPDFHESSGETESEAIEQLERQFRWSAPELDFQPIRAPQASPELTRLLEETDFSDEIDYAFVEESIKSLGGNEWEIRIRWSVSLEIAVPAESEKVFLSEVASYLKQALKINGLAVERVNIESNDLQSLSSMADILSDFWTTQRGVEEHVVFMAYHDLGLPLAFAVANDMVETSQEAERMIRETYEKLLEHLGIPDMGYTELNQLLEKETDDSQEEEDAFSSGPTSEADELAKLHKLFEAGVITEEEFTQKKKQILGI